MNYSDIMINKLNRSFSPTTKLTTRQCRMTIIVCQERVHTQVQTTPYKHTSCSQSSKFCSHNRWAIYAQIPWMLVYSTILPTTPMA